jgi:hypothetical protein
MGGGSSYFLPLRTSSTKRIPWPATNGGVGRATRGPCGPVDRQNRAVPESRDRTGLDEAGEFVIDVD